MHWMLLPLQRYAEFQGRSRRTEYWMFVLGYLIVLVALGLLAVAVGGLGVGIESLNVVGYAIFALMGVFALAVFIPAIAVQVRRLHDQNISGWWLLGAYVVSLIPFIGLIASIALVVFMCLPGTRGVNRFGPDPKEKMADVFA